MVEERIDLDKLDYDCLVLGTDFAESLASAALASRGKSTLNLDSDFLYSGTLKALNLKELLRWRDSLGTLHKDSLVAGLRIETNPDHFASAEEALAKLGFRSLSFDLDPKVLYSTSRATKDLVAIGVDNYTSFRAVKDVAFFQNGAFSSLPVSKSLIVQCPFLGLREKKGFLENLEKLQKFSQNFVDQKNVNSTNELEKEIYDNPRHFASKELEGRLDGPHSLIFGELLEGKGGKKFEDLVRYCICNRLVLASEDPLTARELIRRFQDFVRSAGTHDRFPYLHASYGVGDLTQVFSRVSALFGSVFLISPNYEVLEAKKGEGEFSVKLRQAQHEHNLRAKTMIVGRQFQSVVARLLGLPEVGGQKRLNRFICALKNTQHNPDQPLAVPFLGIIPEGQAEWDNSAPMRVFMTNASPSLADATFAVNVVWETGQSEADSFQPLRFSQLLAGILGRTFSTHFDPLLAIFFQQKVNSSKNFEEVAPGLFFAPNFEAELTIDPYFDATWRFLEKSGLLSGPQDVLVRRSADPNAPGPEEKIENAELINKLEQFKFE